jgi:Flp pilus assembly protein TadG
MAMKTFRSRSESDRGAVLVHVAVALLAMIAISAFAIDYGLFYVSRREAQNAADAGALAGAVALAYDSATDLSDTGPAKQSAYSTARNNVVWDQAPALDIATDVTFPVCPDGTASCVRVNVYRDVPHGNALPVVFGQIVGLVNQNTRATATAEAAVANATNCMKPWIIPDKWQEHYPIDPGIWDPNTSTFDTMSGNGNNRQALADPDQYRPPTDPNMTGFRAAGTPNDIGMELTLKEGPPPQQTGGTAQPGWVYPVRLNIDEPGGNVYSTNIQQCSGDVIKIGDWLRNETGIMVGPTFHGVDPLLAADPNAHWVDPDGPGGVPGHIEGSCMDTASCPAPYSPSPTQSARIMTVPVFNTAQFDQQSGAGMFQVVNILGIFLESRQGNTVKGVLTGFPGIAASGGSVIENNAAFSHTVMLVR